MRMLLIVLLYVFSTTSCGDDFDFIPVEVLNKDQEVVDSLDITPVINGDGDIGIKVDSTVNEYEFVIHI